MGSHLSDVWFQVTDLPVVSGSGCTVTTADGTDYLDFTAGIAVVSTGHCHPKVVAAIQDQAAKFIHAQVNCYRNPLLEQLGERLAGVTPDGIDSFFFANSGAEATEAAVKLAKQATGRPNVIVFSGSFHGRSHLTMAMTTSKHGYRAGYAPLPAVCSSRRSRTRGREGVSEEVSVERALTALHHLLLAQTAPGETAAMVLEPVLGEGGYIPAPPAVPPGRAGHLQGARDPVRRRRGADRASPRTGTMFAIEPAAVVPDVLVMAKGIASGFPISAIGASAELMARWPKGSHGGTYGGNPIGCAAALATIDVLTEPGFLENVNARGEQLRSGLAADRRGPRSDRRGARPRAHGRPRARRCRAAAGTTRRASATSSPGAATTGSCC